MRKGLLFALTLFVLCDGFSQDKKHSTHTISEKLSKRSDAVVRSMTIKYDYYSPVFSSEKHSVVITVMNQAGESDAQIIFHTDRSSSLNNFSAEIFDASGRSVKKIKKGDLRFSDYFAGLASDTRAWYYSPQAATYPFTVAYEYEIVHRDGILSFPSFAPAGAYGVGVENANYILTVPEGTKFHVKNFNTDISPVVSQEKGRKRYQWSLNDIEPVDQTPYAPNHLEVFPTVLIVPDQFTYNQKSGSMDTWANYAKWQWKLLEGRDVLPPESKAKIKELTAGAKSDMEKVEVLYKYLKETRYVLIALGIGGFQPMSAEEVYRNQFGDCKGLSNYMRAMLAECGITSYYVEIGSGNSHRKLRDDYVHPMQSNHAILYVPLESEDLWLECTNPNIPLGYVHSGITDRKALVYRDATAVLVDMPTYPDSVNVSALTSTVRIHNNGTITAGVSTVYRMSKYEEAMGFDKLSASDRTKHVSNGVRLPLAEISGITYKEEKSAEPWASIDYLLSGKVSSSGSRSYIGINPFRDNPSPRLGRNRALPVCINKGYRNTDTITYEIPEGYSVEAIPTPVSIENRFGHFKMTASHTGDKIYIFREMQLNKGTYDPERYGEFKELMDKVAAGNSEQIVLVQN